MATRVDISSSSYRFPSSSITLPGRLAYRPTPPVVSLRRGSETRLCGVTGLPHFLPDRIGFEASAAIRDASRHADASREEHNY